MKQFLSRLRSIEAGKAKYPEMVFDPGGQCGIPLRSYRDAEADRRRQRLNDFRNEPSLIVNLVIVGVQRNRVRRTGNCIQFRFVAVRTAWYEIYWGHHQSRVMGFWEVVVQGRH
jgi:hypothetical protein